MMAIEEPRRRRQSGMTCAMALYKSPTVVHFYLLRISNPTESPVDRVQQVSIGEEQSGAARHELILMCPYYHYGICGFKPECEDINLALSAVIYPVCAHDSSCLRRLLRLDEIRKYAIECEIDVNLLSRPESPGASTGLPLYFISSIYYYSPRMVFHLTEWPLHYITIKGIEYRKMRCGKQKQQQHPL